MEGYVLTYMAIDGPTADDDGVFESGSFGLRTTRVFTDKDESRDFLKDLIEDEKQSYLECCEDEDDSFDFELETYEDSFRLNVYTSDGDLFNVVFYRIEKVSF
jgi:hypothetical protein